MSVNKNSFRFLDVHWYDLNPLQQRAINKLFDLDVLTFVTSMSKAGSFVIPLVAVKKHHFKIETTLLFLN